MSLKQKRETKYTVQKIYGNNLKEKVIYEKKKKERIMVEKNKGISFYFVSNRIGFK
jgi:hypothetical protein